MAVFDQRMQVYLYNVRVIGSNGYWTIGGWRGAPVRLHWTLPVGAFVLGQGRVVPGFWLGFFLIVLLHEIGHGLVVRRFGHRVVSIDVHGLGGVCHWRGDATAIQRARIAWGGVNAQAVVFVGAIGAMALFGEPTSRFGTELAQALTVGNAWLIGLNLIPVPPLDGAEAWKLPRLLRERRRRRASYPSARDIRKAVEEELAELDARDRRPPAPEVADAVDSALRRMTGDSKWKH